MDLKRRLTSRAFWLAVGTIITLVVNEQWTEAMGVAIAYITGDRVSEAAERYSTGGIAPAEIYGNYSDLDSDEVNQNEIMTGRISTEGEESE